MLKYRGVNRTGKTMGEGKKCLMKRNAMRGQKMRTVAPLKWSGNGGTLTRGRERNAYSEWSSRVTLVDTQWAISLQWLGTSPNIIFHYDARRVLPDNKISFRIYGNAVAKWLARGITNRFDLSHSFFHVYGPPPSPLSVSLATNEKLDTVTARSRNFIVKQFRFTFHAARLYLFI